MRSPVSISNRHALTAAAVFVFLPLTGSRASSVLDTMNAEVSALCDKSKDAVVRVHAEFRPVFGSRPLAATGFFIDNAGRFVTSASLVEGAMTCWVEWQGQRFNARLLGTDPLTKLALLQIDADRPTPSLAIGNADELRIGSLVVAMGFPNNLPSAPSVGFVTGMDIQCGAHVFPVTHIRAGCRLREGQLGGPMLNARGEVVGLVIAAFGDDQCYAVPMGAVRKICADLAESGQPQYGYVGLSVTERQCEDDTWHVVVQDVTSNSPAATAGFQDRDILLRICTNEIRRSADVLNTMFYHQCGATISMTFLRDGQTQEVDFVIGHRPVGITPSRLPVIQPNNLTGPVIVPVSAESPR